MSDRDRILDLLCEAAELRRIIADLRRELAEARGTIMVLRSAGVAGRRGDGDGAQEASPCAPSSSEVVQ